MTRLRLTLTRATYEQGDRWTWTLRAGRHVVSSSGSQLYTRRIDCARGAEVGAGLVGVRSALGSRRADVIRWDGPSSAHHVEVQVVDERATP